jgi:hypothetical protein
LQEFWPRRKLDKPFPSNVVIRIRRIVFTQKFDSVHEFRHASRNVVVAIETDGTIRYCFRSGVKDVEERLSESKVVD